MTFEEFVGRVRELAGLEDQVSAERVTRITLGTLAECLPVDLVRQLAAGLPRELGEQVRRRIAADAGSPDEPLLDARIFIRQIAERADVGETEAATYARAVLDVIREAGGTGRRGSGCVPAGPDVPAVIPGPCSTA